MLATGSNDPSPTSGAKVHIYEYNDPVWYVVKRTNNKLFPRSQILSTQILHFSEPNLFQYSLSRGPSKFVKEMSHIIHFFKNEVISTLNALFK
jgi:hypothetical protein